MGSFLQSRQMLRQETAEIDKTDREIDRMVNESYSLTEDEIGIVVGGTK